MSEVDQILDKFVQSERAERTAALHDPAVCVAGHISYYELQNALMLKYAGLQNRPTMGHSGMEFRNIKIYPSASIEEGFYFGHVEGKP